MGFGRFDKPFNPMLGETYEMVTPDFKALMETVSHHPTVIAVHISGEGYDLCINSKLDISFNGRELHGIDAGVRRFVIKNPTKEEPDVYSNTSPVYCIGNLFIGEKFSEPSGQGTMTNDTTGEHAEYTFYKRKMFGNKQADIQSVRGTIFNANK